MIVTLLNVKKTIESVFPTVATVKMMIGIVETILPSVATLVGSEGITLMRGRKALARFN